MVQSTFISVPNVSSVGNSWKRTSKILKKNPSELIVCPPSLIGQSFFCWTNKRFIFSVKKKESKYSYFKIRNFVKLANPRMTYIRHKPPLSRYTFRFNFEIQYSTTVPHLLSMSSASLKSRIKTSVIKRNGRSMALLIKHKPIY